MVYGMKGEGLRDAKSDRLREVYARSRQLSTAFEVKGEPLRERPGGDGGPKGDRLREAKGDGLRDGGMPRADVERAGNRDRVRKGEGLRDAKGDRLREESVEQQNRREGRRER